MHNKQILGLLTVALLLHSGVSSEEAPNHGPGTQLFLFEK